MEILSVYQCLFKALRAQDIDKLVETASNVLDMPIVVTDATFVVVAKYPALVLGDEQWDANVSHHQIRPEYIRIFQQDDHWSAYNAQEGRPILINWGYFAQAPRYSAQITKQGKIIGYVAALMGQKEPEDWHLQVMELLADALSLLMEIQYRSRYGKDIMAGVMLQGLLLGAVEDEREIDRLREITGDTIEPYYVLAAIKTRDPQFSPLEEYLGDIFSQYYNNVLRVVCEDCLYVLFTGIEADFKERSCFKEAAHQLKAGKAFCAFSRVFSTLLPITDYKWQVDRLLEVASILRPDKTIFHFDDYELYASVATIASEVSPENMVHPLLYTLAQHDAQHHTDYLETLRVYVYSCFSKSNAAKDLHIHRNTLLYRLGKIEEIAGAKLTEKDLGCSLYLSFRYMEISKQDLLAKKGLHSKQQKKQALPTGG